MSAFVDTNDGITSPGQSQRINDSSRYNVYKQPTTLTDCTWNNTGIMILTLSQKDNNFT